MRKVIRFAIGTFALALVASGVFAAQQNGAPAPSYRWTNVTLGGGGYMPNIVFSRAERGLAYLRSDMGGAYRWDAAAGRWMPLQDGNAVSSFMGIESIAPDPIDPEVVYLAAGMGARDPAAILRSADRGRTWRVTAVPFAMGGNEPGRGLGERLAIDPNRTSTLFFGSRHDGLWRSDDSGAHWAKVASFPAKGLGSPRPRTSHGGVSFVAIDPASGAAGGSSRRIWAGVADPGDHALYRSEDGGRSWAPVAGPKLFAAKAAMAEDGTLFVGFTSGIGPSDAETGAVWRYRPGGIGRDVTPAGYRASGAEGGFLGVAVAKGLVAVSTINRYKAGDTLWLSRDGGATWDDAGPRSTRDVSATPFLLHEGEGADFGHWISGLGIDPFDPGRIAYTTGATVYATDGAAKPGPIAWRPWTRGIEQTAIITLISPTAGAHLVSGFGDQAGFVHDDLARSPQPSFTDPYLSNTNTLDYAGQRPAIIVRSGSLYAERPRDATLAWSGDGGRTWQPIRVPPMGSPAKREDLIGDAAITVSADGATMIVATPEPRLTRDRGRTWHAPKGLPGATRAVADKVDPARFYAVDLALGRLVASRDGGMTFAPIRGQGLPSDLATVRRRPHREQPSPLVAAPGRAGELWLQVGQQLWRSTDFGESFTDASGDLAVELFGLGKGAVYAIGTRGGTRGIWRSDDLGQSWRRIDDDAHRWGGRYRVISGDPRIAGRVYVGTDGRGIFYGDPMGSGR